MHECYYNYLCKHVYRISFKHVCHVTGLKQKILFGTYLNNSHAPIYREIRWQSSHSSHSNAYEENPIRLVCMAAPRAMSPSTREAILQSD